MNERTYEFIAAAAYAIQLALMLGEQVPEGEEDEAHEEIMSALYALRDVTERIIEAVSE